MKTLVQISLALISGCFSFIYAQDVQNPPLEIRVVAVSQADSTVQSVSNEVRLYYPLRLYVPTAFSPNGDGLNDTFGAVGEGIESYKMTVYNRWGEVVFTSAKVDHKWDGIHKGRKVPYGAYKYEVQASGKEIGEVHKSGSIIVIN